MHASKHRFGQVVNLAERLGDLDPAALAAPAGVDLRFDHPDRTIEASSRRHRLVDREGRVALRHRHAEGFQDRLDLMLMDIHRIDGPPWE